MKWSEVKCSEINWRHLVKCVYYHWFIITRYVAVCRFCAVCCLFVICFTLLFSNYTTHVFLIFLVCLFSALCIPCFFIVLFIVSPSVYSCLFPIFVQFHRPLPPAGNPNAVNKCHIIFMMVVMMMMMIIKSLTSPDELFTVGQKGIWCVLLGHTC